MAYLKLEKYFIIPKEGRDKQFDTNAYTTFCIAICDLVKSGEYAITVTDIYYEEVEKNIEKKVLVENEKEVKQAKISEVKKVLSWIAIIETYPKNRERKVN